MACRLLTMHGHTRYVATLYHGADYGLCMATLARHLLWLCFIMEQKQCEEGFCHATQYGLTLDECKVSKDAAGATIRLCGVLGVGVATSN